jgi:hypothetical protein
MLKQLPEINELGEIIWLKELSYNGRKLRIESNILFNCLGIHYPEVIESLNQFKKIYNKIERQKEIILKTIGSNYSNDTKRWLMKAAFCAKAGGKITTCSIGKTVISYEGEEYYLPVIKGVAIYVKDLVDNGKRIVKVKSFIPRGIDGKEKILKADLKKFMEELETTISSSKFLKVFNSLNKLKKIKDVLERTIKIAIEKPLKNKCDFIYASSLKR